MSGQRTGDRSCRAPPRAWLAVGKGYKEMRRQEGGHLRTPHSVFSKILLILSSQIPAYRRSDRSPLAQITHPVQRVGWLEAELGFRQA